MNHYLSNIDLRSEAPHGFNEITFGAGCFWGVERKFYELEGVYLTSVGYCGGLVESPTYEQVCYEDTGHAEVVKVTYNPDKISLDQLLIVFWECHDPTQGMRQGNDIGSQYRSVIFCYSADDLEVVKLSMHKYQAALNTQGLGGITTEILEKEEYFFAEEYHQQYLAKNPNGYCGIGGTNCPFPK